MRSITSLAVLALAALAVTTVAGGALADNGLTLSEATATTGIARTTNDTYGRTVVLDYDGDGISDLLLGNHLVAPAELFRGNVDGTFTKVREFPVSDRHGAAAADFDHDGRVDIFFTVGAEKGTSTSKANELWLQTSPGSFELVPGAWGANDPSGRGRVVEAFDANGDGFTDLYLGNTYPNLYPSPNRLFLNDRGRRFVEDARFRSVETTGGSCAATADVNRDGRLDLFACTGKNRLWVAQPDGTYRDQAAALKVATPKARGAAFGDVDGDGDTDLVTVSAAAVTVYSWSGQKFVPVRAATLQAGTAVTLVDADRDGDLDIYAVQGRVGTTNAADLLLLNGNAGRTWTAAPGLPQALKGGGGDVAVIDHYAGRGTALVVTNGSGGGRAFTGPRQLIVLWLPPLPTPTTPPTTPVDPPTTPVDPPTTPVDPPTTPVDPPTTPVDPPTTPVDPPTTPADPPTTPADPPTEPVDPPT